MSTSFRKRVDGLRQFIGIEPRNVPPSKTVGAAGTAIYGGYIQSREKDASLDGVLRYATYSDIIANTSIVAAGVRFFLNLVSKADWMVQPAEVEAGQQKQAEEIAELVEEMLYDMTTPWHRIIRRAAMYRMYGFSLQEWTAKRREDGSIGFLDIEPRAQVTIERWDTDYHGRVYGAVQRAPQDSKDIYLPIKKCLYMVDDSLNDSPEGLGLFRHLVKTSKALTRFEQLEGFGFETDLRGIPVGRGPFKLLQDMVDNGDITDAERLAIIAPLTDFTQNHVKRPDLALLLDSMTYESTDESSTPSNVKQWDAELLKGGNTSADAVAKAITRKNRELARVLNVEHLMLGEGTKGSAALSKDKSQSFAMMVDGTLDETVETVERDVLVPLFMLNGWDMALLPTLKTEAIQHREVTEVTGALADMAQAGAVLEPDDPAINEVRDLLGLSIPITLGMAEDASLEERDDIGDDKEEDLEDGAADTDDEGGESDA